MFFVLFKKNLLYWRRSWIGSSCEIILPFCLIALIAYLQTVVDTEKFQRTKYDQFQFPTTTDPNKFPPGFDPKKFMKNCKDDQMGGYAAFAPRNSVTEKMAKYFELLETKSIFFDSDKQIQNYVLSNDYGSMFKNGTRKNLCLALSFDEFDPERVVYNYNLRFNVSNFIKYDHYPTTFHETKIYFRPDDNTSSDLILSKGVLTLQILVESFLLKENHPNLEQNISINQMQSPKYSFQNLMLLEGAVSFVILIYSLIIFLRTIGYFVSEREQRNIEHLENMGIKKFDYLMALFCSTMFIHCIISLFTALFLKLTILSNTDFLLIYLMLITLVCVMTTLGLFISTFVTETKKGIIYGIIVFFVLEIPYIMRQKIIQSGPNLMKFATASPIHGVGQLIYNILQAGSTDMRFGFYHLFDVIYNYKGIDFFIYSIVEIICLLILALYCFYVIPLKFGVPSHPLFFIRFLWKKNKKNEKNDLTENLLENNSKKEYFENVPLELQKQKKTKELISINNLSKRYSKTCLAVDNLNLEIYKNEIFALLGHNGAGKTTTISMISGLINKTKGKIEIMGLDSYENRKQIKKLMGICTQHNPIFPYMTVREHLKLYAQIKGVKHQIDQQIEEVLKDIDLYHKIDYYAKHLSGGQKRKLSVAIAFIGDSKVILLDEPTSGLDAYARRLLWDMIKKYKENRLIILTTHNMDEADNLGDRIGIMCNGKMMTCGSSLFLKKKFGAGYELTIVKREIKDNEKIKQINKEIIDNFTKICPNSKFVNDLGIELKFKLNDKDSKNFKQLFEYLENEKIEQNSKIQNFGVSLSTLQEVFIKVNNMKIKNINKKEQQSFKSIDRESKSTSPSESESLKHKTLDKIRYKSETWIFFQQFFALIKKRLLYFSRDIQSLMCQIFIPIILILIGFAFTKINFVINPPSINIQNSLYPYKFKMNQLNNHEEMNIINNIQPKGFQYDLIQTQSKETFDDDLFSNQNTDQNYSYFLYNLDKNAYNFNAFYNSTAPFAPFLAVNTFHNSLLRYLTDKKDSQITMNLKPFPLTTKVKKLEGEIDGFIITLFLGLGFIFIPSSMIVFIIKEREHNSKHQQIISGTNIFAYWLSNFIVDYLVYLITAMFFFFSFYWMGIEFLTEDDHGTMSLLLFLIYGIDLVLIVYLLSFIFRSSGKGQVFLFVIFYFFSLFLTIIMFVLKMIPNTRDFTVNYLEFVMRIFPPFSFCYGILTMANLKLYQLVFQWDELPKAFSTRGSLYDLIYLSVAAFVLVLVIFGIEFVNKIAFLMRKDIKRKKNQTSFKNDEESNLKETKKNDSLDVQLIDLVKNYKTNVGLKKAVKGISFEVKPGDIFGLLGTNGAGKTTTFKILTGDIFPSSGHAYIKGKEMPEQIQSIRKHLGYCPQFDTILEKLTAQEHLELYATLKGIKRKYHKTLIDQLILTMNLEKYRHVKAGEYSGGNKRKLTVAIAILGQPSIILLDEPSAGMDPESRRQMWDVINNMSTINKNSSIILTTHSMEEAEALVTNLAIMVEGEIKTVGPLQELKSKYGKNYELDIKIKSPTTDLFEEISEEVKKSEFSSEHLSLNDCKKILELLKTDSLIDELGEKGMEKLINSSQ